MRLLEEAGIIKGYRADVDRAAVGLTTTVFIEISVDRHSKQNADAVQERLAAIPGLVSCHMVSGNADFLAEVVVADHAAYERVLTEHILTMEMISNVRSNFALRTICVQQPLALSE
ncbi:Lrp/AsnC family transcriptional regulator [Agaricicola taiwanensis]|uniref:Lrp/AsnC family transcriptional regulator n=1 Tax=Agaricicola taiwanensis TaxID=591372 RepID=UPI001E597C7D